MSTVLLRAAETGRIAKLPTVHASHAEVSAVFDNDLATPIVTAQADGQNHEPAGSVIDRQDLAFGVRLIY